MRSSRKSAILALGAAIGLQAVVGAADSKKSGKKAPTPPPADGEEKKESLSIPVPKGEEQKTVKIPMYRPDGTLDMRFDVGVAKRIDDDNVIMQKLKIETFKDDDEHPGKRVPDMDMDLPDAVLNEKTQDLTSNTSVTIKRAAFEVTGHNMKFNLKTRQGTLGGGVHMIVYDMNQLGEADKAKTVIEIQPKTGAKAGQKERLDLKDPPKPDPKGKNDPKTKADPKDPAKAPSRNSTKP